MNKKQLFINTKKDGFQPVPVYRLFELDGLKYFVHRHYHDVGVFHKSWDVTEYRSGQSMSMYNATWKLAQQTAELRIMQAGIAMTKSLIEKCVEAKGEANHDN